MKQMEMIWENVRCGFDGFDGYDDDDDDTGDVVDAFRVSIKYVSF